MTLEEGTMTVPAWFAFAIVALTAYRVTHFFTDDDWPPTVWLRAWAARLAQPREPDGVDPLEQRGGIVRLDESLPRRPGLYVVEFLGCAYCIGTWLAVGIAVASHAWVVDLLDGTVRSRAGFVTLVAMATASVVGYLSAKE